MARRAPAKLAIQHRKSSIARTYAGHRRWTEHPADPRQWGAKCDKCPLKGSSPVWGDGTIGAAWVIVGEAPGRDEVNAGVPAIGRAGELIERMLDEAGSHRTEVFITHATMCFPPGGDMKAFLQNKRKELKSAGIDFESPVDCCRPRLFKELGVEKCGKCNGYLAGLSSLQCSCKKPTRVVKQQWSAPLSVSALGNTAMEAMLGVTGITERQNYPVNTKKGVK